MKIDIARAWKDENYRQSLSEEQLQTLPSNPVGEISDAELNSVCGGGHGWDDTAVGVTSSSAAETRHAHSWAVIVCDANIFSNDVAILALQDVLNIGSPRCQTCIHAG